MKFILSLLLTTAFILPQLAQAELITNGALDGTAENAGVANGNLSGWQVGPRDDPNNIFEANTPDIMDGTHNFGRNITEFAAAPSDTVAHGTWVGLTRQAGEKFESLGQVVSGFTTGQMYQLTWEEGNFGRFVSGSSFNYLGDNTIVAMLGNSLNSTQSVHLFDDGPLRANSSDWVTRTYSFTATQAEYALSFNLKGTDRSYVSIDNVSITAVAAVPEPQTWALMFAGLMLIGFEARKRS